MNKDRNILIIDDSQMTRTLIVKHLNDLGIFKIDIAANGLVACRKIESGVQEGRPYELIFCDWNMPGLDGEGVLKFVRGMDKMDKAYIAVLSADVSPSTVKLAKELGANIFLTKPFSAAKIKTFIHSLNLFK